MPARGRRAGSRRRARRRALGARSRSAATPSARSSTRRGRPGSRRAAASPTATSCAPASGTSASASSLEVRPDVERFITPLPLNHMNALAFSSMAAILSGGCHGPARPLPSAHLVAERAREPGDRRPLPRRDAGDAARRRRAARRSRSTQVRFGFGAGVDARHHAPFEERFGFPLLEAWAMTETGAAAPASWRTASRAMSARTASAAPSRSSRRASSTTRAATPAPTTPGELLVRAAGADPRRDFFLGYLKDEEATDAAWAGGWFHTGDVVRARRRGRLLLRRPAEERDPAQRREHLGGRGRERARTSIRRCAACAVAADARPDARRRGARLHRPARGASCRRRADRGEHRPPRARAARLLQGAGLRRVRRRAAADDVAEGAARRASRAGQAAARTPRASTCGC